MNKLTVIGLAATFVFMTMNAQAVTTIPEASSAHECGRTQLNNRDCGRWYSLELIENNPRDRYNRPGVNTRPKRWHRVNKPAPKPQMIVLDGVEFDTAKSTIRTSSLGILNENIAKLKSRGSVNINIIGHTDAQGGDEYNQTLSENRAQAILSYFAQNGISSNRMKSAGAGEGQPIDSNDTADGRQRNRRIEVHITRR